MHLNGGGRWYKTIATADAKSNLNLGIHSVFAPEKSRKKFCQDSGSEKRNGITQGAFHSLLRKRKHIAWYLDSSWIINTCIRLIQCFGCKGKKQRIKDKTGESKKVKTSTFWTALLYPWGCKTKKGAWCFGEMNGFSVCCQEAIYKIRWVVPLWILMP